MLPACVMICLVSIALISNSESVILSPSGEVSVCPGEDMLAFACTTNQSFIQWNVTLVLESAERISRTRLVTSGVQVSPLVVNNKSFNITVQGSTPLISTLTATRPIDNINGTEVSCTALGGSPDDTDSLSATVHVVDGEHLNPPKVNSTEIFGIRNVTTILDFINGQENSVMYSVNTDPQADVMLIGNTRAQLTLQYNTQYHVIVVASHRCNQSEEVIELHFVNCGSVLRQINNDIIEVADYNQPAIIGASAAFVCPSAHVLIGPNTTTCMENGEWEPDPRLVECIANCGPLPSPANGYVLPYTSTLEGSRAMFMCQNGQHPESEMTTVCTRAGKWEPNPIDVCALPVAIETPSTALSHDVVIGVASSLSAFSLAAVLFLTVGLACGCYCTCGSLKWKKSENKSTEDENNPPSAQPNPLYEDIVIEEQELELKENAAYSSVSHSNIRNLT